MPWETDVFGVAFPTKEPSIWTIPTEEKARNVLATSNKGISSLEKIWRKQKDFIKFFVPIVILLRWKKIMSIFIIA